jgi:hypothetical protein
MSRRVMFAPIRPSPIIPSCIPVPPCRGPPIDVGFEDDAIG